MRVLYHHRTQAEDAQGIHIYEMVGAFRELGHEVEMASLTEVDHAAGKKTKGSRWGFITKWAPAWLYELMGLAYNLYGYRMMSAKIRKNRPDLIYERYSMNTVCGVWASRRFGIPMILEVNAPLAYEQEKLGQLAFKRLARFTERWTCSNSTRTIVVTGVMRDMIAELGVPKEHIVVMTNGINPEEFHPEIDDSEIRRRHGLEGKTVVGFVGWFRPWHGLEMLLEQMRPMLAEREDLRVLLVGDGPAAPFLKEFVEKHGLVEQVVFTGPVKRAEIPAHVAAMDVTVQPSATAYACPMKIIEYMALGKCIVAPNQPNIAEILADGVNCSMFEKEDPESLGAALARVLRSSEERDRLGRAAHDAVQTRGYLWSENARRALDLARGSAGSTQDCPVSSPTELRQ